MKQLKTHQGFTFIEMLVVVTIMAVLTAVGASSFKVANQKARDGRRLGDLQQIRAALELYRTDQNVYPTTAQFPAVGGNLTFGTTTYMSDRPGDPSSGYFYSYTSATGATYTLCAALELVTTLQSNCGNCGTDKTCSYKVTNPL